MTLACWSGLFGEPSDWDPLLAELEKLLPVRRAPLPAEYGIGYSLGGRVAIAAAAGGLLRRGLVVISCSPGIEGDPSARLADDAELARKIEDPSTDWREFLAGWWEQAVFASSWWPSGLRERLVDSRMRVDRREAAETLRRWGQGAVNLWPALERLDLPVLAVAGERDPKYVACAEAMARRARRARCVVLAGCGHMAHLEQPRPLARELARFMRATGGCHA